MRVLIFRHIHFEHAGRIEDTLRCRGVAFDYADPHEASDHPHPSAYDGLIFMGGPMSVNDDLPYLREEEQYIRDAVRRGTPLLGVCLGSQLIAKALGARVYRNPVKEIGWFELRFTAEAAEDPLFAGLTRETVLHWHGETFDLPEGAVLLASSELCRNQAFRIGERVWGLQFHLEATPEMVAGWCREDENCGDVRELAAPLDPGCNAARLATLSERVFEAWCEILPVGK